MPYYHSTDPIQKQALCGLPGVEPEPVAEPNRHDRRAAAARGDPEPQPAAPDPEGDAIAAEGVKAAATAWAARGFRVFPTINKHPKNREGWREAAASDPEAIVALDWTGADGFGVALDDHVVVDLDLKVDPLDVVIDLLKAIAPDAENTLIVASPSGGRHLYFAMPEGVELSQRSPVPKRIDVRIGGKGYVCGPGVGGYTVFKDHPIAALPQSLVDMMEAAPDNGTVDISDLDQVADDGRPTTRGDAWGLVGKHAGRIRAAEEGERNDTVNAEAFQAGRAFPVLLDEHAEVIEFLVDAAMATGLDHDEAERTAAAALVKGACSRMPARHAGARELFDALIEPDPAAVEPVDPWDELHPPALPEGVVPPVIEDFARAQARLTGAAPGGLALAALATCAGAVTDGIQLQPMRHNASWRESVRLWVALVGDPSAKKSPIMKVAVAPLRDVDREMVKKSLMEKQDHEEALAKVSKDDRNKIDNAAPPMKRRIIDDPTIEAMRTVLVDNPEGVFHYSDELSGWFGRMEKYGGAKGAGADRAFWLSSFNGGPYVVARQGTGTATVPNLSVSILGGIQPDRLREMAGGATDDGLLQRITPLVLTAAGHAVDEPPVAGVAEAYSDLVRALAQMRAFGVAASNRGPRELPVQVLHFTDEARAVREEMAREHHSHVVAGGAVPMLASYFGKQDGTFARMCLLFHLIGHARRGTAVLTGDEETTIDEGTARRVAEFMRRFLRPHAFAFYDLMGHGEVDKDAQALAGSILTTGAALVGLREIRRAYYPMQRYEPWELRKVAERLELLGWLWPAEGEGPKPTKWVVNPIVRERFVARKAVEAKRRSSAREAIITAGAIRKAARGPV